MPVALELAAKSEPWVAHDTRLMVAALAGIALIVILITAAKMHPFLALVLGSALVGIASGVGLGDVITNFEKGVGDTLKEVGLLIALGAMLGKLLAESGGADRIVDTLVSRSGKRMVPWAMALVAMIIGLPMFFEIGLVLLLPVIVLVAKKSELPLMRIAIPKEKHQRSPGDEPANVGEVGNAARFPGLHAERGNPIDELDHDPVPDHPPGRNQHHDRDAQQENGPDLAARK